MRKGLEPPNGPVMYVVEGTAAGNVRIAVIIHLPALARTNILAVCTMGWTLPYLMGRLCIGQAT